MFGRSGAHEIGYANAAVLIALIRALVGNGVLTEDQAAKVVNDAIKILEPSAHVASIDAAIEMVRSEFRSHIAV